MGGQEHTLKPVATFVAGGVALDGARSVIWIEALVTHAARECGRPLPPVPEIPTTGSRANLNDRHYEFLKAKLA